MGRHTRARTHHGDFMSVLLFLPFKEGGSQRNVARVVLNARKSCFGI